MGCETLLRVMMTSWGQLLSLSSSSTKLTESWRSPFIFRISATRKMETSPQFMLIFAVVISSLIAFRSYKRKSLNLSGGVAGFLVMTIHFAAGFRFLLPLFLFFFLFVYVILRLIGQSVESCRYGALLLVFFLTSSKLTKVGEDKKRRVDVEFKEGGQRNW